LKFGREYVYIDKSIDIGEQHMDCTAPPALTDAQLLALLAGEADPAVKRHLEQCPFCRAQAQTLADLQQRLAVQLYRVDCPAPLDLGEFHLGQLPAERVDAINRHLSHCDHCRGELTQLSRMMQRWPVPDEQALQPDQRSGLRVLVAKLLDDLATLWQPGGPAPAFGLRGQLPEMTVYTAAEMTVALTIQDDPEQRGHKELLGLLSGANEPDQMLADLWQEHQLLSTAPVDEFGNFALSALVPGTYGLTLNGPDLAIEIHDLSVR
jgi:hypothetical protein